MFSLAFDSELQVEPIPQIVSLMFRQLFRHELCKTKGLPLPHMVLRVVNLDTLHGLFVKMIARFLTSDGDVERDCYILLKKINWIREVGRGSSKLAEIVFIALSSATSRDKSYVPRHPDGSVNYSHEMFNRNNSFLDRYKADRTKISFWVDVESAFYCSAFYRGKDTSALDSAKGIFSLSRALRKIPRLAKNVPFAKTILNRMLRDAPYFFDSQPLNVQLVDSSFSMGRLEEYQKMSQMMTVKTRGDGFERLVVLQFDLNYMSGYIRKILLYGRHSSGSLLSRLDKEVIHLIAIMAAVSCFNTSRGLDEFFSPKGQRIGTLPR